MLSKRHNSSIINLRVFHNWIKNSMYVRVAKNLREDYDKSSIKVLELAVGKGGDLFKWIGIGASEVVGVDIDKESVFGKNGALHRYRRKKNDPKTPNCYFYVDDLSDPSSFENMKRKLKGRRFNIIACQFAVHYFFVNPDALENIANIVGEFLEPNGYFMGTTMDPDRINSLFTDSDTVTEEMFSIELNTNPKDSYTPYGNRYTVSLGRTNTDGKKKEDHYFADKPSVEYLIDKKELERVMNTRGVNLIEYKSFDEYHKQYLKTDPDHTMTEGEKRFSFLNVAFFFQKEG